MDISQQPPTSPGQNASDTGHLRWPSDDDYALGCECANPALQIERWDQETVAVAAQHAN